MTSPLRCPNRRLPAGRAAIIALVSLVLLVPTAGSTASAQPEPGKGPSSSATPSTPAETTPAAETPGERGTVDPTADSAPVAARAVVARAGIENYRPRTGVRVNNPLRADRRRKIISHLVNSIESVQGKGNPRIRIFSWNLASSAVVRELIDAHQRGASVRLLMSGGKAADQPRKTGDFWRLKRALGKKSSRHPQPDALTSWARACNRSCRGSSGIAHSKYFLFDQVGGKARNVVMSTSANATEVSADSQWNDVFTIVGDKKIYDGFINNFNQASRDKVARPGFKTVASGPDQAYFYPWKGKNARGDRVLKELNRISCRGANGGTGIGGRTKIRIAQDAILDKRGIRIAKLLRKKWVAGCNIRIVYALLGRDVRKVLNSTSRGPVPTRQIVQDFNGDYVYERYLHSKSMAVSGRYGKDRSARIVWQGSENWTGLAKISDEQGLKLRRAGAERAYADWVDFLFRNPPRNRAARTMATRETAARSLGIDPYALIREELRG